MTIEIMAIILTGVGVTAGVLLGVWRMFAHYETRNDAAHAELGRRIDAVRTELGERIDKTNDKTNARIDDMRTELGERIDKTNERIVGVEKKLDARIDEMGKRIDEMGKRIDLVNGRIDLVYQELVQNRS